LVSSACVEVVAIVNLLTQIHYFIFVYFNILQMYLQ